MRNFHSNESLGYVKVQWNISEMLNYLVKVKWKESESKCRSVVSDSLQPLGLYSSWNSPGQNTGVGSLSLRQGIFLTQGSNSVLPRCRRILYQLSHKGSPRILKWVAISSSRKSSWPRDLIHISCVPCIGGWILYHYAPREIATS